jgi:hypothetical protein
VPGRDETTSASKTAESVRTELQLMRWECTPQVRLHVVTYRWNVK